MFYPSAKSLLFKLDPEKAHRLALASLKSLHALGLASKLAPKSKEIPTQCMGLTFPNPVGLAAGLDKNGDYIDALGDLGFGFIEVGTVTPRPQPGNPKPRLFRLPKAQAIINRMGFNNKGVDHLVGRLKRRRFTGIVGANIGKNFDTPLEKAHEDYLICFQKVYPYADYIAVNISSPNTKDLRKLQETQALEQLLSTLKNEQNLLKTQKNSQQRHVPLLIKIAPDLETQEIEEIAKLVSKFELEGMIATNTTIARQGVAGLAHAQETGGLSGAPLHHKSMEVIRQLRAQLGPNFPIIGVGGIMSGQDAKESMAAGANLIQIYTGFIYQGPELIGEIIKELS